MACCVAAAPARSLTAIDEWYPKLLLDSLIQQKPVLLTLFTRNHNVLPEEHQGRPLRCALCKLLCVTELALHAERVANAQLPRLVPAPHVTDEAALNVAAAAAADPAAAIPATAPAATATATAVPATSPAATANEGLAAFAAIL